MILYSHIFLLYIYYVGDDTLCIYKDIILHYIDENKGRKTAIMNYFS